MLRCKEGDLAWITGEPANHGKLVEVGPAGSPMTHDGKYGLCWHVLSLSGPMVATTRSGKRVLADSALIPDIWLTPHRPTGRATDQPEPEILFDLNNPPTIGVS